MSNLPESSGGLASTLGTAQPGLAVPENKPGEGISESKHKFFHWLATRGGSGVLTKRKISILAGGDVLELGISAAGVRTYLEACVCTGLLDFNAGRYTLTETGRVYVKMFPANKTFEGTRHGLVERARMLDEEND